jgi:hypothetical protein
MCSTSCRCVKSTFNDNRCVFQWPGYNEFRRQVQIRDETRAKNPIAVGRFASQIGRSVEAFLRVSCFDFTVAFNLYELHHDHDRIQCQIILIAQNLVAGRLAKAASSLATFGSLLLYTYPPVAGCQSFSFVTSRSSLRVKNNSIYS